MIIFIQRVIFKLDIFYCTSISKNSIQDYVLLVQRVLYTCTIKTVSTLKSKGYIGRSSVIESDFLTMVYQIFQFGEYKQAFLMNRK